MKPSWAILNAYVDGELGPEAAAEVARAVADDRELARQVAALARLKAAAAEAMAPPAGAAPRLPAGRARPAGRRLLPAAAAALALAVLGGLWQHAARTDPTGAWLDAVEERHARWVEADPRPSPILAAPASTPAAAAGEGRIPDLGPMRLEVAHATSFAQEGRRVLHVGYVGVNGCRLSLWIGPAPAGLPAELAEHREDGAHVLTWRAGDTAYAAVARGMDAGRLKAVARYVEDRSRGAVTRLAGAEAEGSGAPCLG
ncbi:hypothetical protein [Arenibaculum sp.]|jgi:hypothetical protein|uniref:hypothetical protein n=1 Tax=Arenibaculum sp. TaxID=2865862 RepID=UPI002E1427A5|nr:hypothetical protein [Arenibaculum sp.]